MSRRIVIHNHIPARRARDKVRDYSSPNSEYHTYSAEVDRGHGEGFRRELTTAKTVEEASEAFAKHFGPWSKVRNVKLAA